MSPSKSEERPPDPDDIWQNLLARVELGDQLEIIRDRLKQLSEQFAKADPGPKDGSVNVEDTHVKQAASILLALARTPEIYAETGAAEVFISFASQQKADAEALCGHLQRAAFRCFLAPESIHYADKWNEKIWHALRVCKCFLPVITPEWNSSRWCCYEFGAAVALNKIILPIVVSGTDTPPPVGDYQRLDVEHAAELKDLPDVQPEKWHVLLAKLREFCNRNHGDRAS